MTNVTMPLGWPGGIQISLQEALQLISIEMLGHAADLEESARRYQNPINSGADYLRKYGWALWMIWLQIEPTAQAQPNMDQLKDIAAQYGLKLPESLPQQQ